MYSTSIPFNKTVFCDQNVSVTKELSDWLAPTNQTALLSQTHFGHRKLCLIEGDTGAVHPLPLSVFARSSFLHAPQIKGAAYIRGRIMLGQIRYISIACLIKVQYFF